MSDCAHISTPARSTGRLAASPAALATLAVMLPLAVAAEARPVVASEPDRVAAQPAAPSIAAAVAEAARQLTGPQQLLPALTERPAIDHLAAPSLLTDAPVPGTSGEGPPVAPALARLRLIDLPPPLR